MNSTTTCNFCRLTYCPNLSEDRRKHNKIHKRYERAVSSGHLILFIEEEKLREKLERLIKSDKLEDQVAGFEDMLECCFNRSLRCSLSRNDWMNHPDYQKYVAMIGQHHPRIPVRVRHELKQRYGEISGEIKPGYTQWHPKKS